MGEVAVSHRDEDLPHFRELAEELATDASRQDWQAYLDADQAFHLGLLALVDNQRLVEILRLLRNQTRLFDVGKLALSGELPKAAAEHRGIITAIASRDRKQTEDLVAGHLRQLRETWQTD